MIAEAPERRADAVPGASLRLFGLIAIDLNADGAPDLVGTSALDDALSVMLGKGDGTFARGRIFGQGTSQLSVVSVDVDLDGHLDLVSVNASPPTVTVYRGDGTGNFEPGIAFETGGDTPQRLITADFNSDGHFDLATSNRDSDDATILFGKDGLAFDEPILLPVGENPTDVGATDLDRDGSIDFVVASLGLLSAFEGRGDGSFEPAVRYSVEGIPRSLVFADFDLDDDEDLALVDLEVDEFIVVQNDGTGKLDVPLSYPTGEQIGFFSFVEIDFDRDGTLDIVSANSTGSVSILRGLGDGSFEPPVNFVTGSQSIDIATADFNGDGIADFVTTKRPRSSWGARTALSVRRVPTTLVGCRGPW